MRQTWALVGAMILAAASGCGHDDSADESARGGSSGNAGSTGSSSSGAGGQASVGGGAGATGVTPIEGYEGFGAVTRGAASCPEDSVEIHVTSLADAGSGTLREALEAGGCRRVVFDVGGTIHLEDDLDIRWSHVTVDGSTAPSPGITIEQPLGVNTTISGHNSTGSPHDIIINNLRHVGPGGHDDTTDDFWGLDGEAAPVYNVVIDHVTGIGANDGVFDFWGDVHDVTISWNLILDTVCALHLSNADFVRQRISFHHNVFARNNERQIRIRHDNRLIDYVNNVVYGWGWFEAGGYGLGIVYDAGEANPNLNVVGNAFLYVDGLDGDPEDAILFTAESDSGDVYFTDNLVPPEETDQTSGTIDEPLPISAAARVTAYAAASLGETVVPLAGTHYRTDDELALLNEIEAAF